MSKKLNVSGLFSSEPLPAEENEALKAQSKTEKPKPAKQKKAKTEESAKKQAATQKVEDANATNVNLSLNLGKIKKKKPIEYISFKLKRDVHAQLSKIAKKENIDYTGNLIHLVLEDFIKQYQSTED